MGENTRVALDKTLIFQSLAIGCIDLRILILDISHRVELQSQISLDDSKKVFDSGTFHVDDADNPMGWDDMTPIDIIIRLREPIFKLYKDPEALLNDLVNNENSPLRHTEAWLLLEAMQKTEVPGMPGSFASFGVRTDWADPISGV
jgi:hypothetical protein